MPSPITKGNELWRLAKPFGTKTKFKDPQELYDRCMDYFEWCMDNPIYEEKTSTYEGGFITHNSPRTRAFTKEGLCVFLGIGRPTWNQWKREGIPHRFTEEQNEALASVIMIVEDIIYEQKFSQAAAGQLNPMIIARDLGLKDERAYDHRSGDGSMSPKTLSDFYKGSGDGGKENED